jgi:Ran GTPase-activating protein (RanGAP) involved in mRNA processing and transport
MLSNNFIGPGGAKAVSKVLFNKKYITELSLGVNGVFAEGAVAIGASLKDKKYLEVFNFKKNEIGLQGMKALEEVLTLSKTVKELNLSGNNIGDEGVSIIIKAMIKKTKQSLNVLSLSDNKITSKGCKTICEFINKCGCLQEL